MYASRYKDGKSLLDLCVQAQRWYEESSIPTKVKACATIGLEELLQLAGVAALTIVPDDLKALQSTRRSQAEIVGVSLFSNRTIRTDKVTHSSYIDDEAKYRMDFDAAEDGRAQYKLAQVRGTHSLCCVYGYTKSVMLIRRLPSSVISKARPNAWLRLLELETLRIGRQCNFMIFLSTC